MSFIDIVFKESYDPRISRYWYKEFLKNYSQDSIVLGPWGKPRFSEDTVQFSTSHSKHLAVLGISGVPLGVDVEYLREKYFDDDCGVSVFYPNTIEKLKRWTMLEALNKCTGFGFSQGLDHSFSPTLIEKSEISQNIGTLQKYVWKEYNFLSFSLSDFFHFSLCTCTKIDAVRVLELK